MINPCGGERTLYIENGSGKVMAFSKEFQLRKDRGRPVGNQAGLPPTQGLGSRRIDGLNQSDLHAAKVRWSWPSSTQAFLGLEQRQTEYIEADDTFSQRVAAANYEEELSRVARTEMDMFDRGVGFEQRMAAKRGEIHLRRDLGVGQYGV